MRGSKAGLADLKRMHEKAQAARKVKEALAEALAQSTATASRQSSPELSEDARKLFARATQAVQPIQAAGRVMHHRAATRDSAAFANSAGASDAAELLAQKRRRATGEATQPSAVVASSPGLQLQNATQAGISDIYAPIRDTEADVAWSAPGIGPDTQRRLKQAYWAVGAHLDLHGMNSDQARPALLDFIYASQQHGTRCVRVVHGQGYGSAKGQAVLKNLVTQWLTQIPAIAAFATAPQAHGGRGALLALIKQI